MQPALGLMAFFQLPRVARHAVNPGLKDATPLAFIFAFHFKVQGTLQAGKQFSFYFVKTLEF